MCNPLTPASFSENDATRPLGRTTYDAPVDYLLGNWQETCNPRASYPIPKSRPVAQPPFTVAVMLMETYSTHTQYNTNLFVHMKSFVPEYLAKGANPALSFSIFALASM